MAYVHFERLSALDLSFLAVEDGQAHMHIGSVSIFDAAPLRLDDGALDFERILSFIESQLHKVPRLRQRIEWVPAFGQPVWVDDSRFNLRYHVRHTALPAPGGERQLKRLAGRILSQEFDRGKPLWEYWFVDSLEGDRFALIAKLHHCIADGISGVEMANMLVGADPDYRPPPRTEWSPRPAPSASQLVLRELRHRLGLPLQLLRAATSGGEGREAEAGPGLAEGFRNMVDLVSSARGGSDTPLNMEVGPHRRFDWTRLSFETVYAVGASAGGTVNDVVLAVASGALRSFLRRRAVPVDQIDFRAAVPVSVRRPSEQKSLGNRVSSLMVRLPLDEPDPWQRLLRVIDTTHELKASGQSGGGELMAQLADVLPARLQIPLFRSLGRNLGANVIITNVPGVRVPVYLLGARQLATYPVVPLAANQALGIALLSYDQGLFWGFNADWDAVPDLHDLVLAVDECFEQLRESAGVKPEAQAPPPVLAPEGGDETRPTGGG